MGAAFVSFVCCVWLFIRSHDTRLPLPEAEDVRSIEASFYDREKHEKIEFEVPREHWSLILSALLPARKDDSPKKWAGLGRLNFKLANGDSYLVSMYRLNHETGAFSAGPTIENRIYYRGGNSRDLEKALAEAFEASERNN